jgi:hypothetical protein
LHKNTCGVFIIAFTTVKNQRFKSFPDSIAIKRYERISFDGQMISGFYQQFKIR